jgi:hypothetical protein
VLVLLFTPVAGLVATSAEYFDVERHYTLVAILVLVVLGVSLALALAR